MSRIYGLCLVRNEGDIITQTLLHASRFCHRIYVWDNGSTDDTWERIHALAHPSIELFSREATPFHDGLRAKIFNAMRHECTPGDWLYILDGDEFLVGHPHRAIAVAEKEAASQINTLQYNFYFSDRDWVHYKSGKEDRNVPIAERRRYYRFANIEQRFFRFDPNMQWPEYTTERYPRGFAIPPKLKRCSYRLPNCHYQYRDPEQIQLRLETRRAARQANQSNFLHYSALDEEINWQRFIVPSHDLHHYNNDGQFKLNLNERFQLFRRDLGRRDFFRFDFLAH